MSGPIREDSKVVSQGELWNQDSNQPCWASLSLFLHSNPCLTLAMDSRTTGVLVGVSPFLQGPQYPQSNPEQRAPHCSEVGVKRGAADNQPRGSRKDGAGNQ